jgi:hypothetical protein
MLGDRAARRPNLREVRNLVDLDVVLARGRVLAVGAQDRKAHGVIAGRGVGLDGIAVRADRAIAEGP